MYILENKIYFKRIIFGTLLILLLVTILFWIIPPERYIGSYYPDFMQQKDYINKSSNEKEIIILGDSALKAAIIPKKLAKNAYNLNIPGGTPIEMYYSLETYLKHHPKPEMVLISFAPYHYADMERYHMWTFYNHYLSWQQELESQFIIFRYDDVPFWDIPGILWEDLQYMLRLPTKYYQTAYESHFSRDSEYHEIYNRISENKGHSLYGIDPDWASHFEPYPMVLVPYKTLPSLNLYMEKLLRLCTDNDIPVNVLQFPMHIWYYEIIQKNGYLNDYFKYLDELSIKSGVEIEKDIPIYSIELFDDSLHLNEEGAELYTKALKEKYNFK